MKKKAPKSVKSPKVIKPFKASLTLKTGEMVESFGDTLLEALEGIKTDTKVMGVLKVEKGEKKVEKLLGAAHLRRLFGDKASGNLKKTAVSCYSKLIASGLC